MAKNRRPRVAGGDGCRLPPAERAILRPAWLGSWREEGNFTGRQIGRSSLALGVAAALLLLPFYLAAPAGARFWVVDFFRASVPVRDFDVRGEEIVALSPAAWMLLPAVLATAVFGRRRWAWADVTVAVAAAAAFALNVLPRGAYDEYAIPFVLPLVTVLLLLLPPAPRGWGWAGATVLLVVPRGLVPLLYYKLHAATYRATLSTWLPPSGTPYTYELPGEMRAARAAVRQALPAGEPFYGPAIILAIEAERPIPRRLRMGPFSMTAEFSPGEASRLNLMTYPELGEQLCRPEARVLGVHTMFEFNYGWSMPSFAVQPPEERARWFEGFMGGYAIAYRDAEFIVLVRR